MRKRAFLLLLSVLLLTGSALPTAAGGAAQAADWRTKVDRWVLDTAAAGETEFLVVLRDQADLRPAVEFGTKAEKAEFVYRALSQHAERTQGPVRAALLRLGVEWRSYWAANLLWVRGDDAAIRALADRADVAHLYANGEFKLDVPEIGAGNAAPLSEPEGVGWNIALLNADDVWAQGYNGQGVVVGGADTGYQWDHPALKAKYRGWNGTSADHNYNWHDAIHVGPSDCGYDSLVPCDDYGHGTHTMGTMVGDDGLGNQVGMAPGARWIGCRNMREGYGTPERYIECYQWFIAPTDLAGNNPDPDMAPDVIDNSWGCPPDEGCTADSLAAVVANVRAAGIVTVHSAGNSGSACGTVNAPAATYVESFTVGSTQSNNYIAGSSSRGPVPTTDGSYRLKPNVAAPGVSIRSSTLGGGYGTSSGTSMAAPHVVGAVALLIDANESLRGNVAVLEDLLEATAIDPPTDNQQLCGEDRAGAIPNNVYGWGRIDALAAYEQAMIACAAPAAVTTLAIAALNAGDLTLSWSAVSGAGKYRVSWSESPYFTPQAGCDAGSCREVATTSLVRSALGDATVNYTYVVQSMAPCGAVQATPSTRAAEFDYELTPGG